MKPTQPGLSKPIFLPGILLLLLLTAFFPGNGYSQRAFDPLEDEISTCLPPLSALIDSAIRRNPYVRFRNQQLVVNECKLKASQIDWTRNLGLNANVGFGNLSNYSINNLNNSELTTQATSRSETKYNAAFYIIFPLNALIGRKNLVRLARTELEQAASMVDFQQDEVRETVIRRYNDLILKQRLLKIRARYLETTRIGLQMTEKKFINGVVESVEYTRVNELNNRAETDYEIARMDFMTAYQLLEEITGIPFKLTPDIPDVNDHH